MPADPILKTCKDRKVSPPELDARYASCLRWVFVIGSLQVAMGGLGGLLRRDGFRRRLSGSEGADFCSQEAHVQNGFEKT